MDRILTYFTYAFILTRSKLRLLSVIFFLLICTSVMALIDVQISFPLNILRTNKQNVTKVCICFDIYKILVLIVTSLFSNV